MSEAPSFKPRGQARRFFTGLAWISPWLIGFLAFMALPLGMSLYYSLSDYPLLGRPVPQGLGNYERMVGDSVFWVSVRNTLLYAAVAIPLGTIVSVGLAILLHAPTPGRTFHRAVIFLPTLVPVVAASVIWMWLYNGEAGLINQALGVVGIEGPNWLADGNWAMPALIIMSLWTVGQAVVIYLAALQDVPGALYEAASMDGVGLGGRIWHVTIPMISPVILFNTIIGIIGALQVFTQPYIMTKGGPGESTLFYAMYLYDQAFRFRDMGYASALAITQLVFIVLVTGLVFWASKRLVHYEGA